MTNLTHKEVVQELIETLFEALNDSSGGSMTMVKPVLNIAKLKLGQLDENASQNLCDQIHRISSMIEIKTGVLSPYHGFVDEAEKENDYQIARV